MGTEFKSSFGRSTSVFGSSHLRPASFLARIAALSFDIIVLGLFFEILFPIIGPPLHGSFDRILPSASTLATFLPSFINSQQVLSGVVPGLFIFLYFIVLPATAVQGTLGKALARVTIGNDIGGTISLFRSFVRFFAWGISLATMFLGFFVAIFNKQRRTFHDFIAGTYAFEPRQASFLRPLLICAFSWTCMFMLYQVRKPEDKSLTESLAVFSVRGDDVVDVFNSKTLEEAYGKARSMIIKTPPLRNFKPETPNDGS